MNPSIFKFLKWFLAIAVLLALLLVSYFIYRLSQNDIFGWRLNFSLNKVETSDYKGFAPDLAFRYPRIFEIDLDQEKKYGKGYLVGIKLRTDNRTGCDVRTDGPELNFSLSIDELSQSIVSPIESRASEFKLIQREKLKIGGQEAFRVAFSFLDPIGARVLLDQIFVADKGVNFMIICGTGEYQYSFFQKDFRLFYDSIGFDEKLEGTY